MVCLKCGAVIANGSKFCSECGCATDVVNESGAVAVQEQLSGNIEYSSQRKMFIIGIVMCICSVILFVFGYRSMTDTKYKHAIENVDYFESQMDETNRALVDCGEITQEEFEKRKILLWISKRENTPRLELLCRGVFLLLVFLSV